MASKKALLVEDDELFRLTMIAVLEDADFDVTACGDPVEVISLWKRHKKLNQDCEFDLILTDNKMPGMTGLEFIHQINQKVYPLSHRRKAIISGMWEEDELEIARLLGCKTFHKTDSLESICDWVRKES